MVVGTGLILTTLSKPMIGIGAQNIRIQNDNLNVINQ
jgi:hypothetical protein